MCPLSHAGYPAPTCSKFSKQMGHAFSLSDFFSLRDFFTRGPWCMQSNTNQQLIKGTHYGADRQVRSYLVACIPRGAKLVSHGTARCCHIISRKVRRYHVLQQSRFALNQMCESLSQVPCAPNTGHLSHIHWPMTHSWAF